MEALKPYLPINTMEKVDQLTFDLTNKIQLGLKNIEEIELQVLFNIKKVKIQLYWKEKLRENSLLINKFQVIHKPQVANIKAPEYKIKKKTSNKSKGTKPTKQHVKNEDVKQKFYPKAKEKLVARTKNEVLFSPNQLVGLTLSQVAETTKVDIKIYYELIGVTSPDFEFRLKDYINLKHKLAKLYKQEIMNQLEEKSKETEKDFDYAKRGRTKTTMGIPGNYFKLILLRNKQ